SGYSSLYLRDPAICEELGWRSLLQVFLTSDSFRSVATASCSQRTWAKHLRNSATNRFGLLQRGEMTALRNLVPIEELRIGLLAPHLRRREKVAFKNAHCGRKIQGHSREILRETLVIEPCRRRSGVGQPVESDVIQHVIERDGLRRITFVVAPCLQLLVDPHCLPSR